MKRNVIIQKILDRIVETVHPVRIILFGSAARGDSNADSDLDFMVVMPDGAHRRKTAHAIYRVLYGIGTAKDIVVATENDLKEHADDRGYIYSLALKEGEELYHG